MSELLLGMDIGTSSSKGVLARPDGAPAERPHELSLPRPRWAEHDAEEIWWKDFVSICRKLLEKANGGIVAVCTSGIGACILPADRYGNSLRPAILYGIDTRPTREIEELTRRYGVGEILSRCGSPLSSQAVGPKLAWLCRNDPEVWKKTQKFFMANSFIASRLTGEYVLDHHSASQCGPLYDVHAYGWIGGWAEEIAPDLPLPRLLWPAEVAEEVSREAPEIPAGTHVAAGTIDAWSEGASVGVQEPGDLMLMYGTTMFMIEMLKEPLSHPRLWDTIGILPETHNLAAGMVISGALTGWLKKISGDLTYERLTEEGAAVPPGSDALIVLPYFAGERTSLFDPKAHGLISGLTISHGRGHLYRAVLEATAYGVRHIFEYVREAGGVAGAVHGEAGDVEDSLVSFPQSQKQARSRAAGLVNSPDDFLRESKGLVDELGQVGLVVFDPAGEQLRTGGVEYVSPVEFLAGIDDPPRFFHEHLHGLVGNSHSEHPADSSLRSDFSPVSISGQGLYGNRGTSS